MRTQLGLPAMLAALLACVMPAWAHRDPNPASNLVMLPGVTITSDGDLPGYPAANAILNAERTPDANGYQVVFANSWQGAAVYDANARQHLTITFPSPVTIQAIAWNSGGCENGFYGGGVWSATLDGHVVVSNKTIAVGGQGGFMHVPYGADPGVQHEIATFSPATATQLVLEFPVTARGPAYNYSIRDINVVPYVPATALIDRSSMTNKVMCGYQGWFLCPGDGNASWWGWNHWSKQAAYIGPGTYNTDIWPDTREYDSSDLFPLPAGTTLTNGGTPYLFSSARQGAVNVHFRWMQENGIDGVFHQVFVGGYNPDPNDDVQRKLDTVLQNVMNASSTYGRTFALEYDISGVNDADIYNKLTGHWAYVCSAFDLKNHPRYLYHNGKPVVVIWGFGFNDSNHPGSTTTANSVITWFKNNGCFVIGGVPGKWRTLDGDSRSGTAWRDVYRSFSGITPWTVGRYSSASDITTWKSRVSADITACNTYSQWYMPTAWPRFGWDNMNGYPCGQSKIASRGGQHLWDQLYAWKSAGAACQFIAMFDEYDESTAIMKLTDNVPTAGCWWTTEGKGEDWYLRLANWGSRMQRGEIPVSQTIPISSSTSPDGAQIISDTIPTTMTGGLSYNVSVTVKNTGETCWNAEMFKLGGVGGSDPFAAARQLMPSGTTVKTNQTYTFNFTMTAPATPGTYTTDWQMVHEVIRWFGATLTRTVTVVVPTPAFSDLAASQPIVYGTTSVTLSGKVGAAGPVYPANGETIAVSINGSVQSTTINDSTGDFSISYNPSTLLPSGSAYTITYLYGGGAYLAAASDTSQTLVVNKRPITATGITAGNKTYDGNAMATLNTVGASLAGVVNGDVVTLNTGSATGVFADKNVAPARTVTVNGLSIGGAGASNYTLVQPTASADITARTLTIGATGLNKVYDGTTAAMVTLSDDRVAGDSLTTSYTAASFANGDAGNSKPVTVAGITVTGPDSANYLFNPTASTTANITRATATVTLGGLTQGYDGSAKSAAPMTAPGGLTVLLTYAGSPNSPTNAGTYQVIGTVNSGNYQGSATNTLEIVKAALTVSAASTNRPYGAANPALTGSIAGLQNGDNITATYATTAMATSPAGAYPIIPALADPSGKLSNYTVSSTNGVLTVAKAGLAVAANDASRTYGAANPVFNGTLTGTRNGDNITATYATIATAISPPGTYAITPTLTDPDGKLSNYTVSTTNGTLTVTAAALTVAANSASRAYGAPNPGFGGTITGIQNGDNITATYATIATATSPVGTYAITPTLMDPSGKLSNYTVSMTNGALTVTASALTVAADSASRTYSATNPVFTGTITGVQNGDTITVTCSTIATAISPVGTYPITPALADPSGKLRNYTVSSTAGTLMVNPAVLLGRADGKSRLYGAANPPFTVTYSGFVNGQGASVVTGTLSGDTAATTNSPVGAYPIGVGGQSAPNYNITYMDGTLTVGPAPLQVTGNDASRAYGRPNQAFSVTISGWANGEDTNVLGGALVLSSPAQINSPVGGYPIIPSGLTSTNYAIAFSNGTLMVTAYALGVTADNHSRSYGALNPALGGTITGLQNGDNITATYATTATPSSPVGAYAITPTLVDSSGKLGNYTVSLTNGSLTVTRVGLTVAANNASWTYGATNPALAATITGFVNGDTQASAVTGAPSLTTAATAGSDVGSYAVVPALGTLRATNYMFSFVNGTLNVTPALLTGTADAKSRLYGAANPPFTVSYSGFVNGQDASVVTGTLSASTTATTTSPAGGYPISVGGQSAPNYTVQFVEGILTITPASLRVTANNKSRTYGAANPAFTASYSGFVNGDAASVVNGSPSLTTAATSNSPVGIYAITPAGGTLTATNYSFSFIDGTLTVARANLTVTAEARSKVYGDIDPALTFHVTNGNLFGSDTLSGALSRVAGENVGNYAILPGTLSAGDNYTLSFVPANLTITPASSSNALASSQNPAPRGSNVVFTTTVTPVLPATGPPTGDVQFFANGTTLGGPVPLIAGLASIQTASLPPGSNAVTAVYAGDRNFYGSTNSLVQVVSVIAQTPSVVGLTANGDGTVTVTFQGTPGAQFLVQAVSDLRQSASWGTVSTNTAGPDGRWTFTESMAAHAQRFYRAATP